MNTVDLVVVAVVVLNGLIGAARGFAVQAFRLASILAAYLAARTQSRPVADMLKSFVPDWSDSSRTVLAFIVIAGVIYFGAALLGRAAKSALEKMRLGSADRAFGFLLGASKGGVYCAVAFQVLGLFLTVLPSAFRDQLQGSADGSVQGSRAYELHTMYLAPLAAPATQEVTAAAKRQIGGGGDGK